MHAQFQHASGITHDIIGAAIEVHRDKGPGLLESIYEWCLTIELELRGFQVRNQSAVTIRYKGRERKESLKYDVLVNGCVLVEVKAVDSLHPIHKVQLLSYMKLMDVPVGLLLNFHEEKLTDGIARLILPGANVT